MVVLFVLASSVVPVQEASDAVLREGRLEAFLKSRGASEAGRSVRWSLPAKSLAHPKRSRRGWDLYVHKGIGILVPSGSDALQEVRRRGGQALVRGVVIKVPAGNREKGDPEYAVDVRELSRRR